MDDLDRKIEEALSAEDRSLMEGFGEQDVWTLWFGVYDGKMRAIAIFATVLTFVLFFGAVYSGWKTFTTADLVLTTRWASGAWILIIMVGFLKLWFWMRMESNRILREVKRLELQIVRSRTAA